MNKIDNNIFENLGQVYSEIIFLKDKYDLEKFKRGNFEFGTQISAILLTKGAGAEANFNNGIAVFIFSKGGLMYQATVGGQKFTFQPIKKSKKKK